MKIYNELGEVTEITTPVETIKLCHSLSSRPIKSALLKGNSKAFVQYWYTAWSILSAKANLHTCKFNLHTDDIGKRLLEGLPYDNIVVDLNELDTHINLFASAKYLALQKEELGTIHIDGDVILDSPMASEMLNYEMCDIIVQNYESTYRREIMFIKPIIHRAEEYFGKGAFCCGIIGFNKQAAKDKFIDSYFSFARTLNSYPDLIDKINKYQPDVIFDLLFEQANLYTLCLNNKYTVKRLCRKLADIFELRHSGVNHYISKIKYLEENIAKCKAAVKEMAPEIYERLSKAEMEGLE